MIISNAVVLYLHMENNPIVSDAKIVNKVISVLCNLNFKIQIYKCIELKTKLI